MIIMIDNFLGLILSIDWRGTAELLSFVSQMIIAITAIIALNYTKSQLSGRARAHIRIRYEFDLDKQNDSAVYIGITIKILNIGMRPIQVSECGIILYNRRNQIDKPFVIDGEKKILQAGEVDCFRGKYPKGEIEEMIEPYNERDIRVSLYVKYRFDELWLEKKISFADFEKGYIRKYTRLQQELNAR